MQGSTAGFNQMIIFTNLVLISKIDENAYFNKLDAESIPIQYSLPTYELPSHGKLATNSLPACSPASFWPNGIVS